MVYFEARLSNGDPVLIGGDELERVMNGIARNDKMVVCRNGAFNPSFFVSIQLAKEKMLEIRELENYGQRYVERPSEFAKLLSGKFQMLSPAKRTEAQEEAARKEREGKSG